MKLALSVGSPTDMLDYLQQHPQKKALYFLDIELQHKINGLDLATKIRTHDVGGKIVVVSSYLQHLHLIFTHRIEVLDFIVKGDDSVARKVKECIEIAHRIRCPKRVWVDKRYYIN